MSDLAFHEIRISKRTLSNDPRTAAMTPPGPKVWVGPATKTPFLLTPITDTLRQQLSVQASRILGVMPPLGGVLIHVGIHEQKEPPAETKPGQHLVNVEILGTGRVPSLVVFIAQAAPRVIKRAPRGWGRKSLYLWAVRG
jgi:hypothetical protein